jgi:hypothetical protein
MLERSLGGAAAYGVREGAWAGAGAEDRAGLFRGGLYTWTVDDGNGGGQIRHYVSGDGDIGIEVHYDAGSTKFPRDQREAFAITTHVAPHRHPSELLTFDRQSREH